MTAGTTATAATAAMPATATAHAGPSRGRPARVWVEQIMGMPVSVHVRGHGAAFGPDVDTAVAQAFSHLRRVDAVFSTWRPDSDLRRVRRGELVESAAHPWLAEVRALCERAGHRTVGLFSATAGSGGRPVYDPTGLVKGWAVEGAARHLALASGIAFCVNAGGDILAGTSRCAPDLGPWRIGVEDPRRRTRIAATVELVVGAVATSGNAARGAHIRDPRTGERVVRDGSATVTGPSLLWADVWATAAFVDPVAAQQALRRADAAYRCLVL